MSFLFCTIIFARDATPSSLCLLKTVVSPIYPTPTRWSTNTSNEASTHASTAEEAKQGEGKKFAQRRKSQQLCHQPNQKEARSSQCLQRRRSIHHDTQSYSIQIIKPSTSPHFVTNLIRINQRYLREHLPVRPLMDL